MLLNIPTHVIAGPLGAGKTSLIRHLMTQRPPAERWAILVNEFGQVGLDAALLATADDGIALTEVAGGCLCCVNGAPFEIGLGRLLRRARPDRLFIEPSGLGHPHRIMEQLKQSPWRGVLNVQPLVMVLDASALAAGQPLIASQSEALIGAGKVLMNKGKGVVAQARFAIAEQLAGQLQVALTWTDSDELQLGELPTQGSIMHGQPDSLADLPPTVLGDVWINPYLPIRLVQQQREGWSIGWRWHPARQFDTGKVERWLEMTEWRRAKLVIRSGEGWESCNAVDKSVLGWRSSEWRKDSRVELIFAEIQDAEVLELGLKACLKS